MKNKFILIIFALIAVAAFSVGMNVDIFSQNNTSDENHSQIALVGMFITDEYLKGNYTAVLKEFSQTDEDTKETVTHKEYVFPDLEGYPFFHCEIEDTNGNYGFCHTNGIISDVINAVNITETGEENSITGTLYINKTDTVLYANPVYQDGNGKVWLEPGTGIGADRYGSSSIKLGNSVTVKKGKTTETKTYNAELKIEYAELVKELYVSEMDKDDGFIKKTVFPAEDIPSEYTVSTNAAYIVVNTVYYDVEGNLQEKRSVYSPSDSDFSYMTVSNDGIGTKRCSEIIWQ